LADQHGVADRLAHLLAGKVHHRVVHPVPRECAPGRARLRLLVLMMRKPEVEPAAVDVELVAQVLARHRRALQVPTRATEPPWCRPGCGVGLLALLESLPQREVARITLAARVGVGSGLHVVDALVGQLAIRGPRAY